MTQKASSYDAYSISASFMNNKHRLHILCLLGVLSSCSDKDVKHEQVDIVGFWEGTYITVGRPDLEPQYLNFLIKEDGTVTNESSFMSEIRINTGTWELSDSKIKFHLSNIYGGEMPNPQSGTADFDATGFLKNGVIINMSGTGAAEFELAKRK